jgi:hypothetical protein
VCDLALSLPAESVSLTESWKVGFTSEKMDIIAIYLSSESDSYDRHSLFVSEEQRRAGSIPIPAGLLKKAGTLQVWLTGEHALGRLKVRKDIRMTVTP